MASHLPLSPEHGVVHRPAPHLKRRQYSRMTAPEGECPYCDARREYNRKQAAKYRIEKRKA